MSGVLSPSKRVLNNMRQSAGAVQDPRSCLGGIGWPEHLIPFRRNLLWGEPQSLTPLGDPWVIHHQVKDTHTHTHTRQGFQFERTRHRHRHDSGAPPPGWPRWPRSTELRAQHVAPREGARGSELGIFHLQPMERCSQVPQKRAIGLGFGRRPSSASVGRREATRFGWGDSDPRG